MGKIIGVPSNGPNLYDIISEHFGHCNYFIGVQLENNSFSKAFAIENAGHSGCMEPVINMKNRGVTDMIVGGIGGRPYMGFLEMGVNLLQGVIGKTIQENVELYLQGKLKSLSGASCGSVAHHDHMH
jgi:predicted Fe-Mo cluster-binding NifX family protein